MLLDVNVLLALAWPNHQFHERTARWFRAQARDGWSTCAITQLGFIRISANPAFTPSARPPAEAATLLARLSARADHTYLAELPPPADAGAIWDAIVGHHQTTDAYLVWLAASHGTKLATLDARLARVEQLTASVELVPP